MILETEARTLWHSSLAVHVSVTSPPQGPAGTCALKVEVFDVPLILQGAAAPLLKVIVVGTSGVPQATVVSAGAVIVGKAAGLT
jgi:hypothetical protein